MWCDHQGLTVASACIRAHNGTRTPTARRSTESLMEGGHGTYLDGARFHPSRCDWTICSSNSCGYRENEHVSHTNSISHHPRPLSSTEQSTFLLHPPVPRRFKSRPQVGREAKTKYQPSCSPFTGQVNPGCRGPFSGHLCCASRGP